MIELTIVILIMGIMAAIAAPRMADAVRGARLQAAANTLAAHVDYIRSVALNEARTTNLVCDNTAYTYSSSEVDFPELRGQLLHVAMGVDHDPAFTLTANFDTRTTLSFDFEGVPMVGSDPMVSGQIMLGYGSDQFRVKIAAGTGETTVTRVQVKGQVVVPSKFDEPLQAEL